MANQFNTVQYELGDIIEDMKVIHKESVKDKRGKSRIIYTVCCTICGRIKKKRRDHLEKGSGTCHKSCCEQITPKDAHYRRLYSIWCGMRTRTTNNSQKSWEHYKDISSEYYKNFVDFYDDLFETYIEHVNIYGEDNTTLDRINPYDDYRLGNVRWATRKTQNQSKNKKGFKRYVGTSPTGEVYYFDNIKDFCEQHSLTRSKVSSLLNKRIKYYKGWDFKREE